MRLEVIAHALGGAAATPTGYLCKCPCHDDASASLSLTESHSGEIILNCFAGCDWKLVKKELQSRGLIDTTIPGNVSRPLSIGRGLAEGTKYYVYKDIVGNVLCRKVKLPNKKMWFERFERGQWIPKLAGMVVPLYNLSSVLAADLVYLCEGEKDAETLISAGLVGTTSHSGAGSWLDLHTKQLEGKTVILIPDNDDPGRKRVSLVSRKLAGHVKELRVFVPDGVPDHGDVTDWVQNGGNPAEILAKSAVVEARKNSKTASRFDYYALFDTVFDNPRKCIFAEKLMCKETSSGLWNPAINELDRVKSEALYRNESSDVKFKVGDVAYHFAQYQFMKEPEFLVDIPPWDGEDRISAMAYLMTLRKSAGVSVASFSELLKEWCGLVFQRLYDPMIQNRILVLQGGQGVGKDTWTNMLVGGLGQFCVSLNVVGDDKDTYLSLNRGLVMKISEFDKTSRTEVSTLKDLITSPDSNVRAPYDRDSKMRLNRCSFISSANAEQLLRDSTGNRRFLILEVVNIQYAYAGWDKERVKDWQMQCLAEMIHLAECKYTASESAWREMRDYIESKTPEDFIDDIAEHFLQAFKAYEACSMLSVKSEIMASDAVVRDICSTIARQHGVKLTTVRAAIQTRFGVRKRMGEERVRVLRLPG